MIRVILDKAMDGIEGLMSWFLRSSHQEYGAKKPSGGGTDINTPGRTLRKRK